MTNIRMMKYTEQQAPTGREGMNLKLFKRVNPRHYYGKVKR